LGPFGFGMLYCMVVVANLKALYESRILNWPMWGSLAFSVISPILLMAEQSIAFPYLPWGVSNSAGLLEILPSFR
ncbi:hypothetical protein PMAYCL1PPCAC_24784, partial [Pristionchus mayeri]